jgi:hypothetical protein
MSKNIREIMDAVESLEIGDSLTFTDTEGNDHTGEVQTIEKNGKHKDWILKSSQNHGKIFLELWFDPEGGRTDVRANFIEGKTRDLTDIRIN